MKNLLLLFLVVGLSLASMAQEFKTNDKGQIFYEEVVQVPDVKKDQLFINARKWFSDNYSEADQDEDVIYIRDSYLGEIAANPYMWMEVTSTGKNMNAGAVIYEIKVIVKEGRYKYQLSNFVHESQRSRLGSGGALENKEPECGMLNMQQRYWDEIKTTTAENIKKMIAELKTAMTVPGEAANDDW